MCVTAAYTCLLGIQAWRQGEVIMEHAFPMPHIMHLPPPKIMFEQMENTVVLHCISSGMDILFPLSRSTTFFSFFTVHTNYCKRLNLSIFFLLHLALSLLGNLYMWVCSGRKVRANSSCISGFKVQTCSLT